jgi:hypothetical protein
VTPEDAKITPEPTAEERAAILAALASLRARPPESAWFRAGLEEALRTESPLTCAGRAW